MPTTARPPESAPSAVAPVDALPVDVATIRGTLDRCRAELPLDGPLPKYDVLEELHGLLRGHVQLLLPIAEARIAELAPKSREYHGRRAVLDTIRDQVSRGLGPGLMSARVQVSLLARNCGVLLYYARDTR